MRNATSFVKRIKDTLRIDRTILLECREENTILEVITGHTALLISHRFSTLCMPDRNFFVGGDRLASMGPAKKHTDHRVIMPIWKGGWLDDPQ